MTAPISIKAVKAVRNLTGFDLRTSLEQVRAIATLASNGTLLPGDFILIAPKGNVTMSEVYAACDVSE